MLHVVVNVTIGSFRCHMRRRKWWLRNSRISWQCKKFCKCTIYWFFRFSTLTNTHPNLYLRFQYWELSFVISCSSNKKLFLWRSAHVSPSGGLLLQCGSPLQSSKFILVRSFPTIVCAGSSCMTLWSLYSTICNLWGTVSKYSGTQRDLQWEVILWSTCAKKLNPESGHWQKNYLNSQFLAEIFKSRHLIWMLKWAEKWGSWSAHLRVCPPCCEPFQGISLSCILCWFMSLGKV